MAYCSVYVGRMNLSIASTSMTQADMFSTNQIGMLGSVFSIVYAVGRIINGKIGEKVSPSFMICIGLAVAGAANVAFSFMPPFAAMIVLWGANAFAQSALWSSFLNVLCAVYDAETAKRKSSLLASSVAIGNVLGIILNTYIVTYWGFEFAFLVPGIITLLIAGASLYLLFAVKTEANYVDRTLGAVSVLKDRELLRIALPAALHGLIRDNVSFWMTLYFVDTYNVDLEETAIMILFIPLMGLFGRLIYPFAYKILKGQEHRVSFWCYVLCAVFSVPLIFKLNAVLAAFCLGMLYALASMINTTMLAIFPLKYSGSGHVPFVSGIMDFMTYFGASVSSLVFGFVIEEAGYGAMYACFLPASLLSAALIYSVAFSKRKKQT